MTKRELKTQLIIDTAFEVWGKNSFYNTSLSSLADALGMTKPALYRYFKNKEALLSAMKQDFITAYKSVHTNLKPDQFSDINSILKDYTENVIHFFTENYNYYKFFVLKLLRVEHNPVAILKEIEGDKNNFAGPKIFENLGFSKINALSLSGFIRSLGGFLLNQKLFSKTAFTNSETDQMIKVIHFVSLHGLAGHEGKDASIDYSSIESSSMISKEDILPYDKIFATIAEVIAEKGIWETTIDSIAEALGMSKSSLYFYFENKDQMIKDVIERETEHLNKLIMVRIINFKSYQEQIYCIFHVMSSYFIMKPSIFSIMNWLRYQFVHKPIKPKEHKFEKFTEYIELISKTTSFNPLEFPAEILARGLNFFVIRELWSCMGTDVNSQNINIRLRKIHGLLMNGLKGKWK